jgi:hypothetical protein
MKRIIRPCRLSLLPYNILYVPSSSRHGGDYHVPVLVLTCTWEQVLELSDWVVPACTTAPLVGELNPSNTPFSPYPLYGKAHLTDSRSESETLPDDR